MSVELLMPSNHLILCCSLLLLPSIFPNIKVFSSEPALYIRWPKYWSFSFSISPSNEYSGLISFRTDWFVLLAVQGIFKSLLLHHSTIPWIIFSLSWILDLTNIGCFQSAISELNNEELTYWKRPWCWERLKAGGEGGHRRWDGWMVSLTQWTWVCANSGRQWKTGKSGMLQFTESQNWTWFSCWTITLLNWGWRHGPGQLRKCGMIGQKCKNAVEKNKSPEYQNFCSRMNWSKCFGKIETMSCQKALPVLERASQELISTCCFY